MTVRSFNKVCEESDWARPELLREMGDSLKNLDNCMRERQRKHWEWAMGFAALRHYGFLRSDKVALGLGVGHEAFMYALTNQVKLVIGTDLYGSTEFSNLESNEAVLTNPSSFSPFSYRRENLLVMDMDATRIVFGDSQFDILFSFSSLEHFGVDDDIERAMIEAYRVLKPGGVYVVALDYMLEPVSPSEGRGARPHLAAAAFGREEVVRLLIQSTGFQLRQPVQFDTDRSKINNVYNPVTAESSSESFFPHLYLGFDRYLFTSLFLALFKPLRPPAVGLPGS